MLDHNQLTPEEAREKNQPLIQDLRRYYNKRTDDNVSLAHIQTRLLEKTAASLPVTGDDRVAHPPLLLPGRHERNTRRKFAPVFDKDRSRYRSRGAIAAAILLVVLVGSFALLLQLRKGTTATAHGWSLVAQFSGTGSQIITKQNIEVGHKFGWLITCTNTQAGEVDVKFNLPASSSSSCLARTTEPLGPGDSISSPVAFPPIQTIQVTTDASTSWELFLFRGTYYPPLAIDTTNWHTLLTEMDGNGNAIWGAIDVTLPRTWALLFVCHGTGDIQISLQSGYGYNTSEISGARAPCNGETNFDVSDMAGQSEKISQIQITTGTNNDWQAIVIGCTNGKPRCGITAVTPTSIP